jgi:hypothetical protein
LRAADRRHRKSEQHQAYSQGDHVSGVKTD